MRYSMNEHLSSSRASSSRFCTNPCTAAVLSAPRHAGVQTLHRKVFIPPSRSTASSSCQHQIKPSHTSTASLGTADLWWSQGACQDKVCAAVFGQTPASTCSSPSKSVNENTRCELHADTHMRRSNPGRFLADELLQLLSSGTDSSSGAAAARRRIDVLLDELQALKGLQFDEQLLQGGPWRVSTCAVLTLHINLHMRTTASIAQQQLN